ncbi:MAG: oxygenase MpaB family protein [Leeuwenhoekiella sp.]
MTEEEKFIWNGIDLEDLRQVMDPPADKAVQSIFDPNESLRHLGALLKDMAQNDDFVSRELPEPMHDLVQEELKTKFTAHDLEMFKQAHHIWKRDGMKFVFILFFRALPYTYMAEKPANVLTTTKLLVEHAQRRIFETAQFVFDVMDRKWWTPHKRGILTALKIRIMHAGMRHVILHSKNNTWNPKWGKPISQEDLIATNQVFSLEFFKGMMMLGKQLSDSEQKAWFHTWKTIGKLMGVQERLICDTVPEAWELQHKVYAHLFKDETSAGVQLAKSLVLALDHFHMDEHLVLHLMKRMLKDEQFPDCFERMLGPSYAEDERYSHLFEKHISDEAAEAHKEQLNQELKLKTKGYHDILQVKKHEIKKTKPPGLLNRILQMILVFFGLGRGGMHLLDVHLDKLGDFIHDENGEVIEKLEEDGVMELMGIFGGIMVGILTEYFRAGKNSGFRMPKDLKENWKLKG